MNREIKVLHTIFELELAPPFKMVDTYNSGTPHFYGKNSTDIGWYSIEYKYFYLQPEKRTSILTKVKRIFNVDILSNDDVYHIAKHLLNWLKDNSPIKVDKLIMQNMDTNEFVGVETDDINHE